jgi:hypothetical protein
LASTRMANASGNSRFEDRSPIITRHSRARRALPPMMMKRRPPLARSSAGPMSGATTANGAMVKSR